MPHLLIQEARTGGRLVAGVVACVCFYTAFFMYEDEQGLWQNRLEELWTSIDDRCKVTHSKAVALFNKIGQKSKELSTHLFGHRLFSLQAIVTSINLSTFGALTAIFLYAIISAFAYLMNAPKLKVAILAGGIPLFLICALIPARKPKPWIILACLIPFAIAVIATWSQLSVYSYENAYKQVGIHSIRQPIEIWVFTVTASVLSDFIGLVLVRKLFSSVASTLLLFRICAAILALLGTAVLVPVLPAQITFHSYSKTPSPETGAAFNAGILLSLMNLSTMFYCLIPGVLLIIVLVHRAFWSSVARFIYFLCRNKGLLLAMTGQRLRTRNGLASSR
jgi:hypothetical protein